MYYGMPTLVECKTLHDCAVIASELSLGFIEINMSFPEYCAAEFDIDTASKLSEKHGLFYTIHADEALNPFDFNPVVSECYFKVMRDTIDVAKKIGATVINMHLQKGIYVTLPGKVILLTDVYKEKYLERVKAFISLCEREIGKSHIKICIENVDSNPFTSSQIDALKLFMASNVFALTLDTGHEVKLGGKDTHVFSEYPSRLLHMHLHDCENGSPHMPLASREVNTEEKLALLQGETCLIEVKTVDGLRKSVKFLIENKLF